MICFCERISPPRRRDRVPPCGAGSFSTWKRNQKTLWGGRNRQDRQSRSCLHAALPLEPPLRGTHTCEVEQNFRRAKSGVLACVFFRPHWGPGWAKFAAAAAPQPRLALPNQRLRCGFRRRGGCPHPPAPKCSASPVGATLAVARPWAERRVRETASYRKRKSPKRAATRGRPYSPPETSRGA